MLSRRAVPQVQTQDRNMNQLQSNFETAIDPLLKNLLLNGHIIKNVSLLAGPNIINHGLNRDLVGWSIIRQRGLADIYDMQDANTSPSLTLALVTNLSVKVDIYVF